MDRRLADMVAALCALALATSASAVQRTFVASYGVDTNPCSVTQPCRTFAAAVALTPANGEVIVLDSAGYGPVTISQPLSIVAPPGVYAGIAVLSGDGITVRSTLGPVVLRGLTINGQGGNRGIVVGYGVVHIESCTVSNMAQAGIAFIGDARGHVRNSVVRSSGSGLEVDYRGAYPPLPDGYLDVQVSDSLFSQNELGIEIKGGSLAATRISVDKSTQHGVAITGAPESPLSAAFTDSVLSWNYGSGVYVSATAGILPFGTDLQFVRSTIAHNGSWGIELRANSRSAFAVVTDSSLAINGQGGLLASGPKAAAVVTRSTFAGNYGPDLAQAGSAVLRTSENNTLTGRGAADVSGALTVNPLK